MRLEGRVRGTGTGKMHCRPWIGTFRLGRTIVESFQNMGKLLFCLWRLAGSESSLSFAVQNRHFSKRYPMSATISSHYQTLTAALPAGGLSPGGISANVMDFCQDPGFFPLAVQKQIRVEALKVFFKKRQVSRVFIGEDINRFDASSRDWEILSLAPSFFNEPSETLRAQNREILEGAVVILNNNDIARSRQSGGYADFFARCDKTIFCAWDWDNHHWLENSCFSAAHSDLYFPAHHENLYLLSRYNWLTAGPVYCVNIQWSRSFLTNRIEQLVRAERSNLPLGKHVPYEMFSFRNRVISTLSGHYPSVGFSNQAFHGRDPEDRLREWCAHKVHWIMPVLNDVPIRIFDALITGGIPIIPASMKYLPGIRDIPEDFIFFFSPMDVVQPATLVQRAVERFDSGGADQIVQRHRFALECHHGDGRIETLLEYVRREFEVRASKQEDVRHEQG